MIGFGFLFFLLLIGLLILGLGRGFGGFFTGHGYGHGSHHGPHAHTKLTSSRSPASEDPKRLLQLRYARGEITREEYQQMLRDLETLA